MLEHFNFNTFLKKFTFKILKYVMISTVTRKILTQTVRKDELNRPNKSCTKETQFLLLAIRDLILIFKPRFFHLIIYEPITLENYFRKLDGTVMKFTWEQMSGNCIHHSQICIPFPCRPCCRSAPINNSNAK
jgi:hypothetical protein